MISTEFYKDNNLVSQFLGGLVQHYPVKERATVFTKYPYEVKYGDSMYTLAKKIFGEDNEHHWTYIADINFLRQPDDLQPGETINLPILIHSETRYNQPQYGKATSTTTKI